MKKEYIIILSIIIVSLLAFFIFIPAFGGKLQISPLINLGFFQIRWYGLIMALAVLVGYFFARKNSWRFGISQDAIDDYVFWLVIVGVIGARIYYVLFSYNYYLGDLLEVFKIWRGGLSIYGGILSGLAFTFFYTRNKAYTFYQMFDLIAISLPLSQAVGRFGNFFNQEAYGTITNLPWKMYVSVDHQFHHPAFLYEAILDLAVFVILYKMLGKVKSGILGFLYLLLYSLGRFFVESIRLDSFIISGFRVDQVVAFLLIVISGLIILSKQRQTS